MNDLNFSHKNQTKIWFMRQAGRYLKEYNEVKKSVGSFLDLCYSPELASEVTLQPIRKFDFDMSIIFSDILVLCDALGFDVKFLQSHGPVIKNTFSSFFDLSIKEIDVNKLNFVYEAIKLTRAALTSNKGLIGFCGAPWTLAAYILENGSSKDFSKVKKFMYDKPDEFSFLIKILSEAIKIHLEGQIISGCDSLQLFDSHSGVLDEHDFVQFVLNPSFEIFSFIKKKYPRIKLIWFPRNSFANYMMHLKHQIFDIIDYFSIDYSTPLDPILKSMDERIFLQGNLDPSVLLTGNKRLIEQKVFFIMNKMKGRSHVFNLGHGIIKTTPVENVSFVIDLIRNFK
jgi:uroporphyrinogen decarboxylase